MPKSQAKASRLRPARDSRSPGWLEQKYRCDDKETASGVSPQKNRSDMTVVEILCYILRYHGFIGIEQVCEAPTHFCCDLESHMQQLPQTAVVRVRLSHMTQRRG